jgi:DNA-binding MarR family transcriptional regulator
MEADIESRLSAHGLSRGTSVVLSAIANDKKTTPAALASFVGIDRAAITRHLDRLEKLELIVREPSQTDRRSVGVKLTRKGARLVPRLMAHSKATNEKFLSGLTSAEQRGLHDLIQKMLANSDLVPGDI